MVAKINVDTSNGVIITSDNSGELELQSAGVTKAKITANGLQDANGASLRGGSFRNLIINGDMRIAQRGTSFAGLSSNKYSLDRMLLYYLGGGYNVEQSTDSPDGFSYSYKITTATTDGTLDAGDRLNIATKLEGQMLQHLKYGTADAETLTASFWVKSSLTGTYTLELFQYGAKHITKTYTVDTANTWEKKTITFAGNTGSSLIDGNSASLALWFWLRAGSTYNTGSATNDWSSDNAQRANGQTVDLAGTSGATFQLTGVQLEVGEGASDFEFLPYDVQLARCMRYYWKTQTGNTNTTLFAGQTPNTTQIWYGGSLPVPMRSTPSTSVTGSLRGYVANGYKDLTTIISNRCSPSNVGLSFSTTGVTAGQGSVLYSPDATGSVIFDSEL